MTRTDLKTELLFLAQQSGIVSDNLDTHVEYCINRGLASFWNAHGWTWSTRPYTLSITSEAESYALPDDFRGIRTVRHKDSDYGGAIIYVPKERFDREIPYPTASSSDRPVACTVYTDRKAKKNYIQFFPVPEAADTIYIEMYTTDGDVDSVPQGFESGLQLDIERFLYQLGTPARFDAQRSFHDELKRMIRLDGPFKGNLIEILTGPIASRGLTFSEYFS